MSIRGRTEQRTARGAPLFFDVFRGSKNRYKTGPKKVIKMGSKKNIPKQGSIKTTKKMNIFSTHKKMNIFSTPECGQSVINRSNIDECQLLVLTPSLVSFWRCFGSPKGGQAHQKATSKKCKQKTNDTHNEPNWSQMGVPK